MKVPKKCPYCKHKSITKMGAITHVIKNHLENAKKDYEKITGEPQKKWQSNSQHTKTDTQKNGKDSTNAPTADTHASENTDSSTTSEKNTQNTEHGNEQQHN